MEDRIKSAGGVSPALVDAYRAVLTDKSADGAFVSAAVSLPSSSELVDDIADADPLLLYEVRASIYCAITLAGPCLVPSSDASCPYWLLSCRQPCLAGPCP